MEENKNIHVTNAGLVLVWPFLGMYFSRSGLMIDGKFNSGDAALKAVFLLQYITDGKIPDEKTDYTLNKILCGLAIDEPIGDAPVFTDADTELANDLLQNLIRQWEKMGNTSIEGLRGSFLMRNGVLEKIPEGWKLRVEQHAYDMLLQSLPWSLSIIKTTWMSDAIHVEWA